MENVFILCLSIIVGFVSGEISITDTAVCNNPFYKVGEKCLHFGNLDFLDVNQSDALKYCNDIGGSLVMIQTPTQFKDIIDYINEHNYLYTYWIDGSDLEQEGKWVFQNKELVPMGTPFWYVDRSDSGWKSEPNNNGANGEACLTMHSKPLFYYNDISCNYSGGSYTLRPLCEESSEIVVEHFIQSEHVDTPDTILDCPVPYIPVGDTCLAFLFYTATMTWSEAVLTCEAMAGTLAKINDPELLRAVYLYLHEHVISEESFWLGGSDLDEEGTWLWLDGSPVLRGPPMWGLFKGIEQPFVNASTNCLGLLSDGYHYLRDENCEVDATYKPICMPQF
ncbi:unnamed protein product [Meganyctiphanes norvegica]|uniref:C-type lectin domain-containing protein n=1 Tax=Meganyctiphanes norvegica TaxID=48144 RepID=A0AAV2PXP6_MEGNR